MASLLAKWNMNIDTRHEAKLSLMHNIRTAVSVLAFAHLVLKTFGGLGACVIFISDEETPLIIVCFCDESLLCSGCFPTGGGMR
jgi:hypothetical protein